MSDDERQIRAIIEYIEDIGEPQMRWPKIDFLMVSYSKWAADKILTTILANPDVTPIRVVEEFRYNMSQIMHIHPEHPEVQLTIQSAYDTATDIGDILMAMMPY